LFTKGFPGQGRAVLKRKLTVFMAAGAPLLTFPCIKKRY